MSLGTISGKKKTTHLMCACIPGVHINKISMQNPILRTIRLHVYKKMHYLQRYLFFCNLAYWTVKFCEILLIEFRLKVKTNIIFALKLLLGFMFSKHHRYIA